MTCYRSPQGWGHKKWPHDPSISVSLPHERSVFSSVENNVSLSDNNLLQLILCWCGYQLSLSSHGWPLSPLAAVFQTVTQHIISVQNALPRFWSGLKDRQWARHQDAWLFPHCCGNFCSSRQLMCGAALQGDAIDDFLDFILISSAFSL